MKLELRDQEIALLQFSNKDNEASKDRYLVVDETITDREFEYLLTHSGGNVCRMEALNLSEDNDKFWLLFNADCAFPPMYLVRAADECDAVDEFLDQTDICTISEEDLKDYIDENGQESEEVHYSDGGKKCDISQLQCFELELLVVITKQGIKAISGTLGCDKLPKIVPLKAKAPLHSQRMLDIT